jgi:membrane fusion protein, multidrug efflux system
MTDEKKGIKTKIPIFLGSILFLVFCLGVFVWWHHSKKYVWTNDAYIEGYSVDISADIEARVIKLFVDEGDYVKEGEPICQLDRSIYDAKKIQAQTNVSLLSKEIDVAKVEMEKMRDDYIIAKEEFTSGIISFLQFDHKEKDFRRSEAIYHSARAAWKDAKAKLGVIKAWLKHTIVHAPMNGVIAKRWIWEGDVANIGQPLYVLNDLEDVWITANLEETKLEHVKIGSPVKIHIDAYPENEFTGHVFVIKGSAASKFALIPPNNATGNFTKVVQRIPVKIHLDRPKMSQPYYFFPGMSCEVKIGISR